MSKLDAETYKNIMVGICEYALNEIEPDFSNSMESLAFDLIKPQLKSSMQRYETAVKNGKKGAEFGKLGGRPKTPKPQKGDNEKPLKGLGGVIEKPLNVNVNVNDTVNENVNEDVNVNVAGSPAPEQTDTHTFILLLLSS